MSKVKDFAGKILTSATAPMDDGFRIPKYHKTVYVVYGTPKVIVDEHIVISDKAPTTGLYAYVPEKVHEFDFWNEYEGFLESNHLKAVSVADYADVSTNSYIVDIENMIVYEYVSHEIGVMKTLEMDENHSLRTRVRH